MGRLRLPSQSAGLTPGAGDEAEDERLLRPGDRVGGAEHLLRLEHLVARQRQLRTGAGGRLTEAARQAVNAACRGEHTHTHRRVGWC